MQKTENKLDSAIFKTLTQKRTWPWLKDSFLDWAIIGVSIYLAGIWHSPLGYVLSIFVIGNRQHALAILGHDGTHFTVAKSKKVNDVITNLLAFWPIGLTVSGYRNLHFQHHKHTNTQHDPELMHRSAKAPQWDLPITLRGVLKYAAWDLVGYSISDYLMIVAFARPDKKTSYVWIAMAHVAFITTTALTGFLWVAALWYFSLTTAFMMFFRLRTWLEHQGSDGTHRVHLTLLERALLSPHNAWYHYEHHQWASVPYSNLPALRKELKDRPVITLKELIASYEKMPRIPSGTALKTLPTEEITTIITPIARAA